MWRLPEAWAPQRYTSRACKFKNLNMKMTLKLKINPIQENLRLNIYPIKPTKGLFFSSNLVKLSLETKILDFLKNH
jgi:hypothetical protein